MIRLALIALFVAGCSTYQPATPEMHQRVSDARGYLSSCASKELPRSDDGISDARSVALTLALRCRLEYDNYTDAYGAANLDNDAQRRMFKERRGYDSAKVNAFLPSVMEWRTR